MGEDIARRNEDFAGGDQGGGMEGANAALYALPAHAACGLTAEHHRCGNRSGDDSYCSRHSPNGTAGNPAR
jgi:hypothetical protein